MDAREYFSSVYQEINQPISVLDEQLNFIYGNSAFSDLCSAAEAEESSFLNEGGQTLAKEALNAWKGRMISVSLSSKELSVLLVPTLLEGKRFLVLQPEGGAGVLRQEEMTCLLRNSYDRLLKYTNEIYSVVQSLDEESAERKELSGGIRRVLRMANHLYYILKQGESANYSILVNVGEFVDRYLEQFNKITERKVLVAPKMKELYARILPEDMELILGTLLSNAVRFGGEDIAVLLRSEGEKLILTVWDSGEGLSEPDRLFEWGWRTTDKIGKKGLGFSLPLAKLLAENQGAQLRYRRVDDGTAFEVVMDRAQPPASILSEWKAEPLNNSLSQFRIEISDI